MDKLIELGFEPAANVTHRNQRGQCSISITIHKFEAATNILYAIIFHSADKEDDIPLKSEVRYIGHTRKTFRNRMNGYQSGCGTAVNHRVHESMMEHLSNGGAVGVMVLPDRHGLQMQGLHLDIAAGLEYALIDYYCRFNRDHNHGPLLNIAGNACLKKHDREVVEEDSKAAQEELLEENADYLGPPHGQPVRAQAQGPAGDCRTLPCSFTFELTEKTYWPKPVFNVPVRCEHHFGPHGDVVQIELAGQGPANMEVLIDRNANQVTHAPRIYFGGPNTEVYEQWKQANHTVGQEVTVEVIGRNSIRLR